MINCFRTNSWLPGFIILFAAGSTCITSVFASQLNYRQLAQANKQAAPKSAEGVALSKPALSKQQIDQTKSLANAAALEKLAQTNFSQGKIEEACNYLQQATTIRLKVMDPDDPVLATDIGAAAALYWQYNRKEDTEKLFGQALAAHQHLLPVDHPVVVQDMLRLAKTYCDEGKYKLARPLLEKVLSIEITLPPERQDEYDSVLVILGNCQEKIGEAESAQVKKNLAK